jgi:hypothetical protein
LVADHNRGGKHLSLRPVRLAAVDLFL